MLAEVHFYSSLEGSALFHTFLSSDEEKYDRHIGTWMYHDCKMISKLRFGHFVQTNGAPDIIKLMLSSELMLSSVEAWVSDRQTDRLRGQGYNKFPNGTDKSCETSWRAFEGCSDQCQCECH